MALEAKIIQYSGGVFELESDYDPEFVEAFKDVVHRSCRSWNRERKRWNITTQGYQERVEELLLDYGYTIQHVLG